MPLSKNRRKNGKKVKHNRAKRNQRLEETMADQPSGVTLQDLINMVAYQEYQQAGVIEGPAIPDTAESDKIDFEDPDTQAIIRAVDNTKIEENEDER